MAKYVTYRGIDYGRGVSNIDLKTSIRYGVINSREVLQAWADEADAIFDIADVEQEPSLWEYTFDGYQAFQTEGDADIWITRSPFYTYAAYCSPCAPGAGDLSAPLAEPHPDNKAYCFGKDWFEGDCAPYPIYRVDTGEKVYDPDHLEEVTF